MIPVGKLGLNDIVQFDIETGPRAVRVSCDVLTRSEALSHSTAYTNDEVEANLETPNHNFTSLKFNN